MFAIAFPQIDPVIFAVGPVAIRWYGLAYVAGIFGGAWYMKQLVRRPPALMTPAQVDDFLLWALFGIVLGGRIGYVLFYKPMEYLNDPTAILRPWEGGMSFHGGMLGTILAIMLFARRHKIDQWYVADGVGCVVPIGLCLGRLANFINGELWGRAAPDVPWSMVFPGAGEVPRHPSQLYQAGMEGLLLFTIMLVLARNETIRRRPGTLTGAFLIGYGIFRIIGEFFREPDAHIGFLAMGITMGQLLSIPMILFGIYCVDRAKRAAATAKTYAKK
ncbi:MAG: prolipoprotein diacylglyceryl transferase [Rhodospirillaceae bacterium]|nr:prolipoprotein diacylglyceryl transferase [Rhodospirillaceae bacterium]